LGGKKNGTGEEQRKGKQVLKEHLVFSKKKENW